MNWTRTNSGGTFPDALIARSMMEKETEIETAFITAEIADAKAEVALTIIRNLVAAMHRAGTLEQTLTQMADGLLGEAETEQNPALFAAMDILKPKDPSEHPVDLWVDELKSAKATRAAILDRIRHQ